MRNDKEIKAEKQLTPFQKTEKVLSKLTFLKGAIDIKENMISDLQNGGKLESKKYVGVNVQSSKKYLSEIEKIENRIEKLQGEIDRIRNLVNSIDLALATIRDDKYFKIIEMKYFEDLTIEYIAEKLDINERTVRRNKNELVRKLEILIFSDEVIKNILN